MNTGSVEHALLLSDKGWSVFPVRAKAPLTPNGFLDASTDENEIRQLWSSFGASATGVGVATGEASGVWVLDVDVSDGKRGDDTLAELERAQGTLPPTYQVITGGGGAHYFFKHHVGIRNSGGKIGPGLDVRGDGGYVVGPGSTHESGDRYRHELESPDAPVDAPTWLIDMVAAVSQGGSAEIADAPVKGDMRPWLGREGWTRVQVLRNGDEYWRRPGKTHGEHSGTWHPPSQTYPEGCFFNHSSNSPGLEAETLYGKKVNPYASEEKWLADLALAWAADPPKEDLGELRWHPVSLYDVWDEPAEDPPSVGCRTDGVFLLYRKKVHTFFGEPGGLKSFFTQIISTQVVEAGGTVLYVDLENSRKSLCDRFRYLGLTREDLKSIDVINPDSLFTLPERELVESYCAERGYELIVLDGTTDAMVLFGLNPLDGVDAAKFDKGFLKPLARTGAAVIYVDHVTKDKESRGSWGIGSQHKMSAIDGAAFGVEMVSSFGKGRIGRAKVVLHKDKNGDLPQHTLEGVHTTIAELELRSNPETHAITAFINGPSPDLNPDFRPTIFMGQLAAYIERNPGLSRDVILIATGLKDTPKKDWVRLAFEKLEADGFIAADLGGGRERRYRSRKPYDELQDGLDHDRAPVVLSASKEIGLERVQRMASKLLPEDLLPDSDVPADSFSVAVSETQPIRPYAVDL